MVERVDGRRRKTKKTVVEKKLIDGVGLEARAGRLVGEYQSDDEGV